MAGSMVDGADKQDEGIARLGLDENLKQLRNWSQSLASEVQTAVPSVEATLRSGNPLPDGCPSRGSLAAMELNGVAKKLSEVKAIFAAVHYLVLKA